MNENRRNVCVFLFFLNNIQISDIIADIDDSVIRAWDHDSAR